MRTGEKSASRVRCTAKSALRPATSVGYSMNSSLFEVQCVTSASGSSASVAGAARARAGRQPDRETRAAAGRERQQVRSS